MSAESVKLIDEEELQRAREANDQYRRKAHQTGLTKDEVTQQLILFIKNAHELPLAVKNELDYNYTEQWRAQVTIHIGDYSKTFNESSNDQDRARRTCVRNIRDWAYLQIYPRYKGAITVLTEAV